MLIFYYNQIYIIALIIKMIFVNIMINVSYIFIFITLWYFVIIIISFNRYVYWSLLIKYIYLDIHKSDYYHLNNYHSIIKICID